MQISVMGEGHTHCVNVSSVHEFTQRFENAQQNYVQFLPGAATCVDILYGRRIWQELKIWWIAPYDCVQKIWRIFI